MLVDPRMIQRKRWLRDWATQHGVPIPDGFRAATPTMGAAAVELVKRVQRRAFQGEHTTGRLDRRTLDLIRPKLTIRERALRVATREVGVTEQPANSNSGPRVSEYQRVTGAYRLPWCASFVAWSYAQVGVWLDGFNTAYVQSYVDAARGNRVVAPGGVRAKVVAKGDVGPGDLACFDWGRDRHADHIGIVTTRVKADGSFATVEANTSDSDFSNGGAVLRRVRNATQVLCFVRIG